MMTTRASFRFLILSGEGHGSMTEYQYNDETKITGIYHEVRKPMIKHNKPIKSQNAMYKKVFCASAFNMDLMSAMSAISLDRLIFFQFVCASKKNNISQMIKYEGFQPRTPWSHFFIKEGNLNYQLTRYYKLLLTFFISWSCDNSSYREPQEA